MSANTFIALPVPGGPGVGAPVNVSGLGPGPVLVIDGDNVEGQLVLEISNDGGSNYGPVTLSGSKNPPLKTLYGKNNFDIAEPYVGKATGTGGLVAQFARIRRISGSGPATAGLGSLTTTSNLFATLNGTTPVSTSTLGPLKTIVCSGAYGSPVVVEGSTDGVKYDAVCQFDTKNSDVKYVIGSYLFMRLRGNPVSSPSGSVAVGAGSLEGAPGAVGPAGPPGPPGPGGAIAYFSGFGLTAGTGNPGPSDYPATIPARTAAGTGRVPFPQDGPFFTSAILRINASSFSLPVGTFEVNVKVHTTEPGQLELELGGAEVPSSLTQNMNPTSGGHIMVITCLIDNAVPSAVLAVINPPGNTPALTITPADGASTHANAQTISIKQIA